MVSKSNFMKFHHSVPEHMTTRDNLPYYSMRSPHPPSPSPTTSPTSAKSKQTSVGEADPSKPIAKRSNICKAQRSTDSARRSVRFSESVRKYRYPLCGKKVSRPSFRQLARKGGVGVTRDNCLPRQTKSVLSHQSQPSILSV